MVPRNSLFPKQDRRNNRGPIGPSISAQGGIDSNQNPPMGSKNTLSPDVYTSFLVLNTVMCSPVTVPYVRTLAFILFCLFVFLQLYVKGELVGGLDILKEMKNDGPLAPQLGIAAKVGLDVLIRIWFRDRHCRAQCDFAVLLCRAALCCCVLVGVLCWARVRVIAVRHRDTAGL